MLSIVATIIPNHKTNFLAIAWTVEFSRSPLKLVDFQALLKSKGKDKNGLDKIKEDKKSQRLLHIWSNQVLVIKQIFVIN